jgi:hypothetical protein
MINCHESLNLGVPKRRKFFSGHGGKADHDEISDDGFIVDSLRFVLVVRIVNLGTNTPLRRDT